MNPSLRFSSYLFNISSSAALISCDLEQSYIFEISSNSKDWLGLSLIVTDLSLSKVLSFINSSFFLAYIYNYNTFSKIVKFVRQKVKIWTLWTLKPQIFVLQKLGMIEK